MTEPWEQVALVAVGGLTDVGFSPDGRWLQVLGHRGRGVLDCHSGARVARDDRDDWSFLADDGLADGIGPADGQRIPVAGLMSRRRLPPVHDPWSGRKTDGGIELRAGGLRQVLPEPEEIRAFGFSDRGDGFVVATPSSLRLLRLRGLPPSTHGGPTATG